MTLSVLEPATEGVLAEIPRAGVEETDAESARPRLQGMVERRVGEDDEGALWRRFPDRGEEGGGLLLREEEGGERVDRGGEGTLGFVVEAQAGGVGDVAVRRASRRRCGRSRSGRSAGEEEGEDERQEHEATASSPGLPVGALPGWRRRCGPAD